MKNHSRLYLTAVFIAAIAASFLLGGFLKEQEYSAQRESRCRTFIAFAAEKAENQDLSEQGVIKALISDIYAAHQFCDNAYAAAQLHDLWNELIFSADKYIGNKESLTSQLTDIAERIQNEGR